MTGVAEWQRAYRGWLAAGCPDVSTGELPARRVPPGQVAVLLVLSTYADGRTGERIHPGLASVAAAAGVSASTVKRATAEHVRLGWLALVGRPSGGRGGGGRAASYRLTTPETQVTGDPRFRVRGMPGGKKRGSPQTETGVTGDPLSTHRSVTSNEKGTNHPIALARATRESDNEGMTA